MQYYDSKADWEAELAVRQLEYSSWGYGSASAVDVNGTVVGQWIGEFDCSHGTTPQGWLK